MATPKLDTTIDALDWEGVRCQCGSHGDRGCRDYAVHQAEVHAVDKCRSAGLTPDGNAVVLLCARCLGDLRGRIRIAVEAFTAQGQIRCRTCSHPLTPVRSHPQKGLSDMSEVNVEPVPGRGPFDPPARQVTCGRATVLVYPTRYQVEAGMVGTPAELLDLESAVTAAVDLLHNNEGS